MHFTMCRILYFVTPLLAGVCLCGKNFNNPYTLYVQFVISVFLLRALKADCVVEGFIIEGFCNYRIL